MRSVGRIKFIVKVTVLLAAVIGLLKYASDGSSHPHNSSTFAIKQDNLVSLSNDSPDVGRRAFSFLPTSSPLNWVYQRTAEQNPKGMDSVNYRDSFTATPHSKYYKGTTSAGDPLIGEEQKVAAEIVFVPKEKNSVDYQDGLVLTPPSDYQKTTLVNDRATPSPTPTVSHKNLSMLYKESEDVFGLLPDHYLPEYKSFCWFGDMDKFQCLASIYLAGMPKCGTTDLYAKLIWHPELSPQSHGIGGGKEFHYWVRSRIGRSMNLYSRTRLPPPTLHFKKFLEYTGAEKVQVNKTLRLVDGTPSLLWDMREWEKRYPWADEPPYSNADLIHAVTPEAKILILLRQPIDRLYSDYLYFWRQTAEIRSPDTFHNDVLRETRRFNRCLATKTLRNCCYSTENSLRVRLFIGVYVCYVRDWKETFRDRLMVLTLEEYHSYPIKTLTKIFNFIEVSEPNLQELATFITDSESIIKNDHSALRLRVGEMRNDTREILQTFYGPHNAELAALLQDTKFLFNGIF